MLDILLILSCPFFLPFLSLSSGRPSRLWVSEADDDQGIVSLAVLHQGTVPQDSHSLDHFLFTNFLLYLFLWGTKKGCVCAVRIEFTG
jgi:hypothetical protein